MVNIAQAQAILTHTTGHAILIVHQYHNVHILIQDTVAFEGMVAVYSIAIGALLQQKLVLFVILLLQV